MDISCFENIIDYLGKVTKNTQWEDKVYAVGGCVRDKLMGLTSIKDIDLVIASPDGGIKFTEWLKDNGFTQGDIVTYPTYGTAMCRLKEFENIPLECVQTRKEQYKDKNSRNPETAYGTIEEDALRRDLTINALYLRVSDKELSDPTGKGLQDLRLEVIRTTNTPSIVYSDDPLRILRAIRFSSRFGWDIESETLAGMEAMVDGLRIISVERIQTEFNSILTGTNVRKALETMMELGIMKYVIPELIPLVDLEQNKYHDATVWVHTLRVVDFLERRGDCSLEVMMAGLLHDIGKVDTLTIDMDGSRHFIGHELKSKDMTRGILKRLKYSNRFIDDVCFIVGEHMWCSFAIAHNLIGLFSWHLRKFQLKCGTFERYCDVVKLIDADKNSQKETAGIRRLYENLVEMAQDMVDRGEAMFGYVLPVNGDDVMRIKHIGPGTDVKRCLDYLMKVAIKRGCKCDRPYMLKLIKGFRFDKN